MSKRQPSERIERPSARASPTPTPFKHRRRWRPARAFSRIGIRIGLALVALIALVFIASLFADEPIRRSIEAGMNRALTDYTVRVPKAHFQLIGASVTLHALEIHQKAHPDPAVLVVPRLHASVQWRELIFGHVVADFLLEQPVLYMNLPQLRQETQNPTPVQQRGWQQALEAIYPLKINLFRVQEATVTYIDEDPRRPLRLTHLNLRAGNIRNIHSRHHVYPSTIHAEAVIFDSGRGSIDGHADFLAEPFPGLQARFDLRRVPLDPFHPVAARSSLSVHGGLLSASGEGESAPGVRRIHLEDVTLQGLHVDYIRTPANAASTAQKKTAPARKSDQPPASVRLDRVRLLHSELGLVSRVQDPPYRLFLSDTNAELSGLSNEEGQGPATAKLSAKFMGAGPTQASATFRAAKQKSTDFNLKLEVKETPLTSMNDLLRAHGHFDVVAGIFSLYAEVGVKNQEISGWVKPLFQDVKVYDRGQEAGKPPLKKLYEGVLNVVAKILENRERKEVATVFELHGRLDNPRSNIWQIVGGLLENAFIKAILPGFDREARRLTSRATR